VSARYLGIGAGWVWVLTHPTIQLSEIPPPLSILGTAVASPINRSFDKCLRATVSSSLGQFFTAF
jgi:hypothetical protein